MGNYDHHCQIFDSLSYSKAGSVLRMLANYVGEDVFLKGVSIYLKKHLYGNSVTNDLWAGVAEASGVDVLKMMDNWVTKVCTSLHVPKGPVQTSILDRLSSRQGPRSRGWDPRSPGQIPRVWTCPRGG